MHTFSSKVSLHHRQGMCQGNGTHITTTSDTNPWIHAADCMLIPLSPCRKMLVVPRRGQRQLLSHSSYISFLMLLCTVMFSISADRSGTRRSLLLCFIVMQDVNRDSLLWHVSGIGLWTSRKVFPPAEVSPAACRCWMLPSWLTINVQTKAVFERLKSSNLVLVHTKLMCN